MKNLYKNLSFTFLIFLSILSLSTNAHWTTKGPYGGSVSCMVKSDTLVFVGTKNGGVYRSTNAAATSWRYANYTDLGSGQINDLVLMGTRLFAASEGGIWVTTNNGTSWSASNTGLGVAKVNSLIYNGQKLVAGTPSGAWLSTDGQSWTQSALTFGINDLTVIGSTIYAATVSGVYTSTDNGLNWTDISGTLGSGGVSTIAAKSGLLLVGNSNGAFYTSSSAISWTNTGLGAKSVQNVSYISEQDKFYVSMDSTLSSSSDGSGWTNAYSGITGRPTSIVYYLARLFVGTENDGIYQTNALLPPAWTAFNTGFNNLKTYKVYNDGNLVIVSTAKGLFVSRDLAANYASVNNGLEGNLVLDFCWNGSKLIAATLAGVFESADTGTSWVKHNVFRAVEKIFYTNGMYYAYNQFGDFKKSTDLNNWTSTSGIPSWTTVTGFATRGNEIYVSTNDGVYGSFSGGDFITVNNGLFDKNVHSLVVKGNFMFAATNSGVFKTDLATIEWDVVIEGLDSPIITALHASGNYILAGGKGRMYASYTNGSSWEAFEIQNYIPSFTDIVNISYSPNSTRIFIATEYNCAYSNGVGELPTGIAEHAATGKFSIFPNPSNGSFVVNTADLRAKALQLNILDLSGKVVFSTTDFTKVDADLRAGYYVVQIITDRGAVAQSLVIQ